MNSREKIYNILSLKNTGRKNGFWTGNPHPDTYQMYFDQLKLNDAESLFNYLNDDCRWLPVDWCYYHPEGKAAFNTKADNAPVGCGMNEYCRFANAETIADVEKYEWPNPEYLDFSKAYEMLKVWPDKAVFTGLWTCTFHLVADFFGMEEYFIKMYENPEVVDAVTERVNDFFVAANNKFFAGLGDLADTYFFGNDLGTQLSTLISKKQFERFIMPGFQQNIAIAKKYNKKVILHSCGAVNEFIPLFIDMGVDGLHPLQAKALHMDAETLSREYKNKIAFMGGIDTQDLLIHCTPQQIKDEVRRVRDLLGANTIISPSHEALLPNVPIENVIAMSEAALED